MAQDIKTMDAPSYSLEKERPVTLDLESNRKPELDINLHIDRFPRAVYLVILYKVCEAFCYHGIKNLLNQYLKSALGLRQEVAKSQIHLFNSLLYFFPLVGAAISDSFLGKFFTILLFSVFYLIGSVLLVIFSINNFLAPFGEYPFWSYILPAVLIAVGAGGIRPCVSTHASDQFPTPRKDLLDKFYSVNYVGVTVGKLIAQYLTPLLKERVRCFGSKCYFLAYGIPTFVLLVSILVFAFGYRLYRIIPPQREFLPWKAVKLTTLALYRRIKASKGSSRGTHWLSFSKPEFDDESIGETYQLGKVSIVAIPIIFFWAIYDQKQTEWQNQYEKMEKSVFGFIPISTEVSSSIGSILIIIILPILTHRIYPWLEKRQYCTTLIARMAYGFFFAIMAFVLSNVLEYLVDNNIQNIQYESNTVKSCLGCLNGAWQLPQWILITLSEALMIPSAEQFAYIHVGPRFRATSSSLFFLTNTLGNLSIFILEPLLVPINRTTNKIWVYLVIATVSWLLFIYLGFYWFHIKNREGGIIESGGHQQLRTEKVRVVSH